MRQYGKERLFHKCLKHHI